MKIQKAYIVLILFAYSFAHSLSSCAETLILNQDDTHSIYAYTQIYHDATNEQKLSAVISAYNSGTFLPLSTQSSISCFTTYWLRLEILNNRYNNLMWMLCLNSQVSHINIYTLSNNDTLSSTRSPISSIAINNITRNKVLIPLHYKQKTTVYIQIHNKVLVTANLKNMELKPKEVFEKELSMHGFLVGGTFGGYVIMFIFSIFLCFTQRKTEFIFYSLYIFFNGVFALFGSFITDKYLFAQDPWQAYNLHATIIIGHIFYVIFVRSFIEPKNIPPKFDHYIFKPFIYLLIIVNTLISLSSFFNFVLFKITLDYALLIEAGIGFIIVLYLFRIKLKVVRIILIGSCVMVIAGVVGQVVDMFDLSKENYWYNIGVLIEVLFFAYAINLKQKQNDLESKNKEIALLKSENELNSKRRELTQMTMFASRHQEMLSSLKEKLEQIRGEAPATNKSILSALSDIEVYHSQSSWDEFEKFFTEVHPDFYKKIKEKHPSLTVNELRLCTLLKLALNTKEIAAITFKTPKSIDIMRNRIRQKMNLNRDESLFDALSSF